MGLAVQKMFDGIADRYDFLNHFLSAGRDRAWRSQAIDGLQFSNSAKVLDLCGGTGDFWQSWSKMQPESLPRPERPPQLRRGVIADFSLPMLQEAARKFRSPSINAASENGKPTPYLVRMDALKPCFKAGTFDVVLCGFGMRNLDSLSAGIQAVGPLLRTQGTFLTLEFFRPTSLFTFCFYRILAPVCIPIVGWMFSSKRAAYTYLVDSILKFCSVSEYAALFRIQGYSPVSVVACDFGISHIVTAVKGK